MAKPLENTVGSFTSHGETLTFGYEQVKGERRARWTCSCGRRGEWFRLDVRHLRGWRATLFFQWQDHVLAAHPEFTLDATVDE